MKDRHCSGAAIVPLLALAFPVVSLASACTGDSPEGVPAECGTNPLFKEAQEQGSLRVIVRLAGDFRSEAELGETEILNQRRRIAELQDQLVRQLAGTEAELLRRFERLPLLVFMVDEVALCRLLTSSLVESVELSEPEAPADRY